MINMKQQLRAYVLRLRAWFNTPWEWLGIPAEPKIEVVYKVMADPYCPPDRMYFINDDALRKL